MINAIYPSLMCVLISMSAFWIRDEDSTRIVLGVIAFLSIKSIGYTFNQGIPPVGYPKVLVIIRWCTMNHLFIGPWYMDGFLWWNCFPDNYRVCNSPGSRPKLNVLKSVLKFLFCSALQKSGTEKRKEKGTNRKRYENEYDWTAGIYIRIRETDKKETFFD